MMSIKTRNATLVTSRRRPQRTTKVVTAVVRSGRRRTRNRAQASSGPAAGFLTSYAKTLNDPFEYSGVPLGYDCFLPTVQTTAYLRSSFAVNSTDGSFSLTFMPDIQYMVQPCNVLRNAVRTGVNYLPATNNTSIAAQIAEARVVSGGLRCFALFPETSAPGVLFGGTAPDFGRTAYDALSCDALASLPGSKIGIGSKGMYNVIRPYDNGSFEFFNHPVVGYTSASIPYMTTTYIAGVSFPIGTIIWYEAVLNLEGIAKTSTGSSAPPIDDIAPPTMSSYFPTPGQLFTSVQSLLTPSVVLDGIDAAVSIATGQNGRALGAVGRIASTFGQGRNTQSFSQRRSRENTVMIEEMKEEHPSTSHGWSVLRR